MADMPLNPLAGVAGPGEKSVRTDQLTLPSASYGEGTETAAIKAAFPMEKAAPVRGATGTEVREAAANAPLTRLYAPTERPDEPITSGIALGPGAGPEALGVNMVKGGRLSDALAQMLPYDTTGEITALYQEALSRGD